MRKSRTHSARALGKKSAGKRGGRKRDARAPIIVLCALGVGILTAGYGLTHQRASTASANIQTPGITASKNAGTAISGEAARKEDRLATGSIPKQDEIATPKTDSKAAPQVAKKKKLGTAVAKAEPKSFFDVFKPATQPKR